MESVPLVVISQPVSNPVILIVLLVILQELALLVRQGNICQMELAYHASTHVLLVSELQIHANHALLLHIEHLVLTVHV